MTMPNGGWTAKMGTKATFNGFIMPDSNFELNEQTVGKLSGYLVSIAAVRNTITRLWKEAMQISVDS